MPVAILWLQQQVGQLMAVVLSVTLVNMGEQGALSALKAVGNEKPILMFQGHIIAVTAAMVDELCFFFICTQQFYFVGIQQQAQDTGLIWVCVYDAWLEFQDCPVPLDLQVQMQQCCHGRHCIKVGVIIHSFVFLNVVSAGCFHGSFSSPEENHHRYN